MVPAPATSSSPTDPEAIRAWARANGHDVPMRGRIPARVRQAWEQAHRNN
ncbi:histone-like nucleoid-structuring protein Lsr2 [Streptomyces nogalater]